MRADAPAPRTSEPRLLPAGHIELDDGDAAGKSVLVAQPLEDTLGRALGFFGRPLSSTRMLSIVVGSIQSRRVAARLLNPSICIASRTFVKNSTCFIPHPLADAAGDGDVRVHARGAVEQISRFL